MKKLFCLVLSLWSMVAAAEGPTAVELLAASDRARGAAASTQGLSWTAEVETVENGETKNLVYDIKVRGNDAIAQVTSPPRQKGELILFNDRSLWYVKPGIKKPVSISPRQRLVGQAANGDIASTQYARDYEGTIAGEETIKGTAAWKLDLKAKAKNVTYDKITYWISKKEQLGIRAEFLTVSGEVFKMAEVEYGNTMTVGGKSFPFVKLVVIQDAKNAQNVTKIKYQNPRETNNPPSLFNVNNLLR
ncbi:MAG: outer membrane lipoprotein-sorting protein [Bdellovibrionales bacterium]|nr:outer membrane lipoprotein-sorting protein [Bdellovibrionales bacterium]